MCIPPVLDLIFIEAFFLYPDEHSQEDPFATVPLEAPTVLDLLADPRKPRQLKNSTTSSMHSWATPTWPIRPLLVMLTWFKMPESLFAR